MDMYCLRISIAECPCMDIRAWISMWISTLVWIMEDWHPKIMDIDVDIRGIFGNPCMDLLWILGPGLSSEDDFTLISCIERSFPTNIFGATTGYMHTIHTNGLAWNYKALLRKEAGLKKKLLVYIFEVHTRRTHSPLSPTARQSVATALHMEIEPF